MSRLVARPRGPRTRLELLRRRGGFSQADVSKLSGLAASTISSVEAGRYLPSPRQLARLADVLGVPVDDAFSLLDMISPDDPVIVAP